MFEQTTLFDLPQDTLEAARQRLEQEADQGIACPCCGVFVKTYKRKLNAGMARMLISIYRKFGHHPAHLQNEFLALQQIAIGREYSKLRYWGLLEEVPELGPGFWRLTPQGLAFAQGGLTVPRHILLRNNHLIGFSGDPITIREALADPFVYEELMGSC